MERMEKANTNPVVSLGLGPSMGSRKDNFRSTAVLIDSIVSEEGKHEEATGVRGGNERCKQQQS
jgi:hypothetical protein